MSGKKPDGYAWVIPFLHVRNTEASLAFYEAVLGCARKHVNEQDGRIVHAELEYRGRIVALVAPEGLHGHATRSPASDGRESSVELLAYVDDVDACYRRAVDGGATGREEPKDWPWGERLAHFIDPDGYHWLLAQSIDS